jgi:hypothetical protein
MKMIRMLFGLAALLFLASGPLAAQIPASELPPSRTGSGLEGKYDPVKRQPMRMPYNLRLPTGDC